jgi:hypothetical protein
MCLLVQVECIFSPHVLSTITKSALNASLPLNKITKKLLSTLIDAARKNPALALPVTMHFASYVNYHQFGALCGCVTSIFFFDITHVNVLHVVSMPIKMLKSIMESCVASSAIQNKRPEASHSITQRRRSE